MYLCTYFKKLKSKSTKILKIWYVRHLLNEFKISAESGKFVEHFQDDA